MGSLVGSSNLDGGSGGGFEGGNRSKYFIGDGEDEISIESIERGQRSFEREGKTLWGFRSSGKAGSLFPRFAGEEKLSTLSFTELLTSLKMLSEMVFHDCSTISLKNSFQDWRLQNRHRYPPIFALAPSELTLGALGPMWPGNSHTTTSLSVHLRTFVP